MGLFGSKKKTEEVKAVKAPAKRTKKTAEVAAVPAVASTAPRVSTALDVNQVIVGPRITEKATMQVEANNVYVFEITEKANKISVRQAVAALYNVTPIRVAITRNPSKKVNYRGRSGVTAGVKKAYVYLKKGDKIELV